ncbi:MAG TPA: ricin-type beta-trefoil lectin domain protein [Streptosporangiaceae bacterium]|nr:ricin-type beta-trefoil lectin domain protein [Streptosporangiaceae bacterium]
MKLSYAFSRRGPGLAMAVLLVVLAVAIPVGTQALAAPRGQASAATVTVNLSSTGGVGVTNQFAGFSYEKQMVGEDLFSTSDTNLVNLFKLLGPNVLRVGGNTADETTWNSSGSGGSSSEIAPADVSKLAAFLQAVGWKVIYGINLKTNSVSNAVSEATYAAKTLGGNLLAFEIGNEPMFYDSESTYESAYATYEKAIAAAVPGAVFDGPGNPSTNWIPTFASAENTANLRMLSVHYYVGSATGATIAAMLASTTPSGSVPGQMATMQQAQQGNHIPAWRVTEGNSFYHGGAPGVSNVEAAALWALALQQQIAAHGGWGLNYHGGGADAYTPITYSGLTPTGVEGVYYGQLLWHLAGTGPYRAATVSGAPDVYAWGIGDNVIIDNEGATPVTAKVTLAAPATSAKRYTLTAPSLTSASVTIAGSAVSANGSFSPNPSTVTVSGTSATVAVPAHSADLLATNGGGQPTTIVGGGAGLCLSTSGGSTFNYTTGDVYTCNSSPSESWVYDPASHTIMNANSGSCLSVTGGSTQPGTTTDLYNCNGSPSENWAVQSNGTILNTNSQLCLSLTGDSTALKTTADVATCNGSATEDWALG